MRSASITLIVLCLAGTALGQSLALDDGQSGIGFAGGYTRVEGIWSIGLSASASVLGRADIDAIISHTEGGPDAWGFGIDLYLIRPSGRVGPVALTVGGSHRWASTEEEQSYYVGQHGDHIFWTVDRDITVYSVNALLHHGVELGSGSRLWLSYGVGQSGTNVSGRGSEEDTFGTISMTGYFDMSPTVSLVFGPSALLQDDEWYFGFVVGAAGGLTGGNVDDLEGTRF